MEGVIEQVPDALNIVAIPVPLTTEHAFDAPAEYENVPSELDDGLEMAVTVVVLPYLADAEAEPVTVLLARFTVRVPVA